MKLMEYLPGNSTGLRIDDFGDAVGRKWRINPAPRVPRIAPSRFMISFGRIPADGRGFAQVSAIFNKIKHKC
jgi:hypothetical protein